MPAIIQSKNHGHRYPFISADILTSSLKLAEALVPVKEIPVEEQPSSSESDDDEEETAVTIEAV